MYLNNLNAQSACEFIKQQQNCSNCRIALAGKENYITPKKGVEAKFQLHKCGHAAMMEHPQEFNKILEEWLVAKNL